MNQYQVFYSTQSLNDIKDIYSYIYYDLMSPISAKRQTDRIRKAIRELGTFPNRHPIVDFEPWHTMKMHQLSVNNYVIFYFVNDTSHTVQISRIMYSGRDIEKLANE